MVSNERTTVGCLQKGLVLEAIFDDDYNLIENTQNTPTKNGLVQHCSEDKAARRGRGSHTKFRGP